MNSYVCKIFVLETKEQQILKPKKLDQSESLTRFVKANSIKKCLFGVSNPVDTQQMLHEELERDRHRFITRFGFDIGEIENLENEENNENNGNRNNGQVSKKCVTGRRILKGQRRVFKPHNNQAVITDFYPARKSMQSTEKLPDKSKEN